MTRFNFKTPSRTSPKNGRRGCLCPDNTYHRDCCDGSLQAQGIGSITRVEDSHLLLENGKKLLQEDNYNINLE